MKSEPSPQDNSLHRILVVDDEEIVLVALRETLRREGYQVETTTDALRALEMVRQEQYAVIITDQMMPLLSGLEFLAQVKQIQPDATRILITAVLSLGTVIDAINKGEIYRFIVKPWLREELLATVRSDFQGSCSIPTPTGCPFTRTGSRRCTSGSTRPGPSSTSTRRTRSGWR
jgi:DNA-binding NtrC family response regulator